MSDVHPTLSDKNARLFLPFHDNRRQTDACLEIRYLIHRLLAWHLYTRIRISSTEGWRAIYLGIRESKQLRLHPRVAPGNPEPTRSELLGYAHFL